MSWLSVIHSDELNSLNYNDIRQQRRGVCFKHFPVHAVLALNNGKRILKKGFKPTLNLNFPSTHNTSKTPEIVEKRSEGNK